MRSHSALPLASPLLYPASPSYEKANDDRDEKEGESSSDSQAHKYPPKVADDLLAEKRRKGNDKFSEEEEADTLHCSKKARGKDSECNSSSKKKRQSSASDLPSKSTDVLLSDGKVSSSRLSNKSHSSDQEDENSQTRMSSWSKTQENEEEHSDKDESFSKKEKKKRKKEKRKRHHSNEEQHSSVELLHYTASPSIPSSANSLFTPFDDSLVVTTLQQSLETAASLEDEESASSHYPNDTSNTSHSGVTTPVALSKLAKKEKRKAKRKLKRQLKKAEAQQAAKKR